MTGLLTAALHAGADATDPSTRTIRTRVQVLLTLLLVGTNIIGAGIVFSLNFVLVPGDGPNASFVSALAVAAPVYVVAAVVVGATTITLLVLRSLQWFLLEQDPTPEQRRATLRLPWRITIAQFWLWMVAAVTFTALALWRQPEAALSTIFAVGIAGLVVSTIAFLFTEYILRPVAARALAGRAEDFPVGANVQSRMVLFWGLGTGAPVLGLGMAALVNLTRPDSQVADGRLPYAVLALSAIVLLFGLLVTVLAARAVVMPILAVRQALEQVGNGDLDVRVVVNDGTELGQLQDGFNDMARGLRERDKIRDLFGRHVGDSVASAATSGEVELGGEVRMASVLMIDLVGSTTYATEHSPREVVEMLNRFFAVIVEEVSDRDGLVNKFMGDAVLAVFGAPNRLSDHSGLALRAARAIVERLADEVPEIRAGIGVATGEVVAGNVGHQTRFEYTVIGDAVNSAARLTELAKDVPGGVMATWATVSSTDRTESRHWEKHGSPVLRGRDEPTDVAVLVDGGSAPREKDA
ncbi:adenylate/guanylate cyclase domain-containing protein [Solicola sp. PLA-1-18]|uniref:adenylate/guanylate cyclase domain-containing protein n=1 Tax=Solicola sp. PLA-1-18 TaxID=3380532 RepID=UPI003B7C70F0